MLDCKKKLCEIFVFETLKCDVNPACGRNFLFSQSVKVLGGRQIVFMA